MGDDRGPGDVEDDAFGFDAEPLPTAGERVLFALGQLQRLWTAGQLPVNPKVFDVEDVARIVGVSGQLEFVTANRRGRNYHFANEVLVVCETDRFPWRLSTVEEWAAAEDLATFWTDFES